MIYREVAPHPKLRKHIKCFWMLAHDYASGFHDHEHLWADAHTELIFTSGQRYFRKVSGRNVPVPQSFVIGPFQNELELFSKGRTSLVAARFWPWGFHPLSRITMTDLKNTVCSCLQALGSQGDRMDKELAGIDDPEAKIAKLSQSLLNVFVAMKRPRLLSRPMAIDIIKSRGEIRVNELSQKHGFHARRLQRVFLDEIGVTAKVLSQIIRFNHAKQMIEKNPDIDLLTLTYECGYADQPHFTRNFREMFGITPSDFRDKLKEAFKRFREKKPDVVFLQDSQAQPD
jgi:AraC-like DNA-binding protein